MTNPNHHVHLQNLLEQPITGNTNQQLDREIRVQQLLEEQRNQQALLLLRQQREIELNFPDLDTCPLSGIGLNNQISGQGSNLPFNQYSDTAIRNTTMNGNCFINQGNPTKSQVQIECRNIILLQEELERQLELKFNGGQAYNIPNVANQDVLSELVKVQQLQQQQQLHQLQQQEQESKASAERLLAQFLELDQLVSRQESIHTLKKSLNVAALAPHAFPNMTAEHPRNPVSVDQLANIVSNGSIVNKDKFHNGKKFNQATPSNLMSSQIVQELSSHLPTSVESNQAIDLFKKQELTVTKVESSHVKSSPSITKEFKVTHHDRNKSPPKSLKEYVKTDNDRPEVVVSNESSAALPSIRYFNHGVEIQENSSVDGKEDKAKKRKLASKGRNNREHTSSRPKQKQKRLPLRKVLLAKMMTEQEVSHKKMTKNQRKSSVGNVKKTTTSKEGNGVKKSCPVGPHHDLMVNMFSKKRAENTEKVDDKMDAANALLGFKKKL